MRRLIHNFPLDAMRIVLVKSESVSRVLQSIQKLCSLSHATRILEIICILQHNVDCRIPHFLTNLPNNISQWPTINTSKDAFSFYLSQLRIRVEMFFGRLVKKWGILQSTLCCSMQMISKILVAWGKLRNFCIGRCTRETDSLFTSSNLEFLFFV